MPGDHLTFDWSALAGNNSLAVSQGTSGVLVALAPFTIERAEDTTPRQSKCQNREGWSKFHGLGLAPKIDPNAGLDTSPDQGTLLMPKQRAPRKPQPDPIRWRPINRIGVHWPTLAAPRAVSSSRACWVDSCMGRVQLPWSIPRRNKRSTKKLNRRGGVRRIVKSPPFLFSGLPDGHG